MKNDILACYNCGDFMHCARGSNFLLLAVQGCAAGIGILFCSVII